MKPKENPQKDAEKRLEGENSQLLDEERDSFTRRNLFGLGGLGVAGMIAAACSSSDFGGVAGGFDKKRGDEVDGGGGDSDGEDGGDGGSDANDGADSDAGDSDSGTTDTGLIEGDDGAADGGLGDGSDADTCHANNTTKVDTNHPDAPDDIKPRVVFYGNNEGATDTSLIAYKFENTTDDIDHVILTKEDGTLIALEGITGADRDGDAYRPDVIDNLFLNGMDKVIFIIKVGDKRFKHEEPIVYKDPDEGHLSPTGLVAGYSSTNAVVAQFDDGGGFGENPDLAYPSDFNPGTTRKLKTVRSTTKWTLGAGMSGFTFTDIMGDAIDLSGGALIEHQVFIAIKGGQRTILMIG